MIFDKISANRVFLAAIGCFFTAALILAPAVPARAQATGTAAVAFELPDLSGATVALSKFKGQKPVLIYFWASWCPHCLQVRPAVISLRNEISKNDLEVLALNVGGGDSLAKVKKFEEAHPAPYTVLYDAEGKVARSYKVQGIPHFILIDKGGIVKYSGNQLPAKPMDLLK